MKQQIAKVVQQYVMMKHYGRPDQLPKFKATSGICFNDEYVVSYRGNATDWFDDKSAFITGYNHTTRYGEMDKLVVELFEEHGWDMDFNGQIPLSVLEAAE